MRESGMQVILSIAANELPDGLLYFENKKKARGRANGAAKRAGLPCNVPQDLLDWPVSRIPLITYEG